MSFRIHAFAYADVWNTTDVNELKHKIDVLCPHCETAGRDPAQIRKTVGLFDDPFADMPAYPRTVERYA